MNPPLLSADEALAKIQSWCAYSERCTSEVKAKLVQLGVSQKEMAGILEHLREEDYLSEERFARSFVRGKFNLKKWGRVKIAAELRQRQVPGSLAGAAMEEIEEADYEKTLCLLIEKKAAQLLPAETPFAAHFQNPEEYRKLNAYLLHKGYEQALITRFLSRMSKNQSPLEW